MASIPEAMQVYRLGSTAYIKDMAGTGARIHGGRWNRKGTAMLYASAHRSLAILEVMAHTPAKLLPPQLSLLSITIPDDLKHTTLDPTRLPANWRQYPAPHALAAWGNSWVEARETAVAIVPSVLVPEEHNLLLNPGHPAFSNIQIQDISPFELDSRF